jgi:hypothetical protein
MKQMLKHFFQKSLPSGIRYILSWLWVKQFLYWLIISAGTIAECAFLLASIWMSVNSSIHPFVLTMMSEKQAIQLSYIATTIFTALPELILSLALVTTINHCRNIRRVKAYWYTWVWPVLFGLPTIVFLYISIMTVSCSVLKVNYAMPAYGIVARALAGYVFAIVYLLYDQIGKPCYASERKALEASLAQKQTDLEQTTSQFEKKLQTANEDASKALAEKQSEIERITSRFEEALQTANSNFTIAMQSKQSEFEYQIKAIVEEGKSRIEQLQNQLETREMQVQKLSERASSLEREELAFYPKVQVLWIEKAKRTVSFDEIVDVTGLSKQRIRAAITGGKIARDNRNKDLFRVSSVVEWLKTIPVSEAPIPSNGHSHTETPLGEFVEMEV